MNVVIIGGGAVGSTFAALFSEHAQTTLLVRRAEHAAAISENGVELTAPDVEGNFAVEATIDPTVLANAYLVVVVTKTYDTSAVADTLHEHANPDAVVLTLQNGLGSREVLASAHTENNVIDGVTFIAASKSSDTEVTCTDLGRIVFGEADGEISRRCSDISTLLKNAGFEPEISSDVTTAIWTKLAFSVAQNALSAITGLTFGEFLENQAALLIARSILDEFSSVAKAKQIDLGVDPYEQSLANWKRIGAHHSSMWHDLNANRRTEIDSMNGKIVAIAGEHGIDVPVNVTVTRLIHAIEQGHC